ncbi:MAG: IS630 family transposase [Chthoniobacter sp.]
MQLGKPEEAAKIEAALKRPVAKVWQRQRLQAMQMAAQGKWTLQQIGDAVGAGRSTVAGWLKLLRTQGFDALLHWQEGQGAPSKLSAQVQAALQAGLAAGRWRRARDLLLWLRKEHGIEMGLGGAYYYLGKAGGVLKVPRKTHAKKDAAQAERFKVELAERLQALPLEAGRAVRVWVADEHRYGLISVLRRCWGLRGVRVHAPYQTKYVWGYLHSALEVDGQHAAQALFSSSVNLETSGRFLEQIQQSDPTAQHVIIWDQAGFHPRAGHATVPAGLHLLSLPPYSPELNAVEKIGAFIKDAVCNKVWQTMEAIEAAISEELEPLWRIPQRVAQLIGEEGWLTAQLNASAKIQ